MVLWLYPHFLSYNMENIVRSFGWKKDLPDHRDFKFSGKVSVDELPEVVDNRSLEPSIYDQGDLGSCTANATLSAFRQTRRQEKKHDFKASRLAHYYWTREIEETVNEDAGAEIRDAVKVLSQIGTVAESRWPYKIEKFTVAPTPAIKRDALKHTCLVYESVPLDVTSFRKAIYENGHVIIGIAVFQSFVSREVGKTGNVPVPGPNEVAIGGHAMLAVGYDMTNGTAIVKNSWGKDWGDAGNCHIPFSYLLNPEYSGDYWTLKSIGNK